MNLMAHAARRDGLNQTVLFVYCLSSRGKAMDDLQKQS